MSGSPAPMILLASSSLQRRAILEQLGLPFEAVPPRYEEQGDDPLEHAVGKARSVDGGDNPVLGVDTIVRYESSILGKPAGLEEAVEMLNQLSGRTHEVISGLCLRTPAWEEAHTSITLVTFRPLTPRDIGAYVATGEWRDRAGAYAIQGRGAGLVAHIEGDYLNVVGLPASVLIHILAERFAGSYGYG